MGAWILDSRRRLKGMLILAASLFLVCSLSSIHGDEKGKRELEIKAIRRRGLGPEKVDIPGGGCAYYEVGTTKEKIFAVLIKNNTREEKRDVRAKLFVYNKKQELIEEKLPRWLNDVYINKGYSLKEGTLSPRKSVKLYFAVDKRAKYVKAELFCEGKLMDARTDPRTFKPPEVEKLSSAK